MTRGFTIRANEMQLPYPRPPHGLRNRLMRSRNHQRHNRQNRNSVIGNVDGQTAWMRCL
jgi:hypothetical protein